MAKKAQMFVVRDAQGGYCGTYSALTSQQAIELYKRGSAAYQSVFRGARQRPGTPASVYTATVEALCNA